MPSKSQLILSRKWSTGRGPRTSVERFCTLLDPDFPSYHGQRTSLPPRVSRFLKGHTNSRATTEYSAPYNSFSSELELWGVWRALRGGYRQVFFAYADYDFYYWRWLKRLLRAKVILWSFFSVRELDARFQHLRHFADADLVLAAGQAQVAYLRQHIPASKVHYFPIGVDTEFFAPVDKPEDCRVVHAGCNRRDFDTFIQAMDIVAAAQPGLRVDLIGATSARARIPERSYLQFHEFLSDEELRGVMQRASVGVLALEDGGSSNSLLEMMASGLPVVMTDVPNARDYVDDSFALRVPLRDSSAMAGRCICLIQNAGMRNEMRFHARNAALGYSWTTLTRTFRGLLEELL